MAKIRVEGHLLQDRSVLVCSGETADDVSWARDEATGQVFVVLEHIPHEDVIAEEEPTAQGKDRPRYFGLRLYGGAKALPQIGRVLEVA
ncbi:MAG: hypothetical protein ABW061_28775 [Polyangiaceae bacterium]